MDTITSKYTGPVDAVVSFVNPSVESWRKERAKYTGDAADSAATCRYRKNAPLALQIKLIRKNMKFIRTVYVVCPSKEHFDGECLEDCGDVRFVEDSSIIPDGMVKPVFNSHAVELFLHRIDGLSECFVYFNDDMYPAREMSMSDFLTGKGALRFTVTPSSDMRFRDKFPNCLRGNRYANCAERSALLAWTAVSPMSKPPKRFYWLDHYPFMFFRSDCRRALKRAMELRKPEDLVTRFRDYDRNIAVPQYYSFFSGFSRGWKMRDPNEYLYCTMLEAHSFRDTFLHNPKIKMLSFNDTQDVDRTCDTEDKLSAVQRALTESLEWLLNREDMERVDWKKYFDRIICLHYLPHSDRIPGLEEELRRVGILDSGIFEYRYTVNDPFERFIEKSNRKLATLPEQNRAYTSILLNYHRILSEAHSLGYHRILVLEDDVRFLKDVRRIREMLDNMPDAGVVQFDKHLADAYWDKHPYGEWRAGHLYDDGLYLHPDGKRFGSSACVAFTHDGMREVMDIMERTYNCPDSCFMYCGSYAVADTHLAVQVMYGNGAIRALYGYDKHRETYGDIGVDPDDYNLPDWYIGGKTDTGKDVKGGHMKNIQVYAITKNEAKFVDRWVDSMQEADGIHVLDTGSTDDTVEKLRARGVHVEVKTYDPWRFDTPRNDAMKMCPADTDIFVSTDLDEVLEKGWRKKLEDAWTAAEKKGPKPTVCRYNYIWGWKDEVKRIPERMFRYEKFHDSNYEWRYPVHELLFRKDESKPTVYVDTDILLEHHPDGTKSRGSYLPLLELSVKEDPTNARNVHYLAREYGFRRDWDNAIKWHRKFLDMKTGWSVERARSMAYLGDCYRAKGDSELAELWYRRGIDAAPEQREAGMAFARMLYSESRWADLEAVITGMFVRSPAPPVNYVTELGAWGPEVYDLYGIALWNQKKRYEAAKVYEAALEKYPDDRQLKDNLARCNVPGDTSKVYVDLVKQQAKVV